jgi:hypothetical protein
MSKHEEPCDCWLCQGGVPDDLVERIKNAKPIGERMNASEFNAWLASIGDDDAHPSAPPC